MSYTSKMLIVFVISALNAGVVVYFGTALWAQLFVFLSCGFCGGLWAAARIRGHYLP